MTLALLMELEEVLLSKGKLSILEEKLFNSFKAKAVANFIQGATISFSVVWPAFWAIPAVARLSLSTFAGVAGGRWNCARSTDAATERFLGLQGTRIQTELASLILKEYKDDKSLLMLVRKHFYSEQVFGDVNSDVSLFRWRPRNTYVDSAPSQHLAQADRVELNQKTQPYHPTTKKSETTSYDYSENSGLPEKQNTTENRGWDLFVDPLECIFGYAEGSKETKSTRQSEVTEVLSRRQARALKRAERRQRSSHAGLS